MAWSKMGMQVWVGGAGCGVWVRNVRWECGLRCGCRVPVGSVLLLPGMKGLHLPTHTVRLKPTLAGRYERRDSRERSHLERGPHAHTSGRGS